MAKTKDFAKHLAEQLATDPALAEDIERERLNGDIAVLIYNERVKAGLTQKELADKAGTHQSAIARLENAEYDGRNVEVLRKILHALGRRLRVSAELLSADAGDTEVTVFSPDWINQPSRWTPTFALPTPRSKAAV